MGFSFKKFLKNPIKETFHAMAKLPGSPEALVTGIKAGIEGEASWNPYAKGERSVWDIGAGGTELSQNEKLRDVGRAAGTLVGGYFAAGALGGGAAAPGSTTATLGGSEAGSALTALGSGGAPVGGVTYGGAAESVLGGSSVLGGGSSALGGGIGGSLSGTGAGLSTAGAGGAGWGSQLLSGAKDVLGNGYADKLLGLVGSGVQQYTAERAVEKADQRQTEREDATRRRRTPVGVLPASISVRKGVTNG